MNARCPFCSSRDKSTPSNPIPTNSKATTVVKKNGRDVGKRLFESGTYKDPRLLYDVSSPEKESRARR